jgi:hypothetical protein
MAYLVADPISLSRPSEDSKTVIPGKSGLRAIAGIKRLSGRDPRILENDA